MNLKDIQSADVAGKRVLLRTSLNVPLTLQGEVADAFRLESALPTITWLAEQGAKIILVGYIGRTGGTLAPVARALQTLVPHISITFTQTPIASLGAEVTALQNGTCLMLENIRLEEGEEKNDPALAAALASLADVFVNDAFAEAHRTYASNVGVATLIPSYAGMLFQEECTHLEEALTPPSGAVAVIGGAKFETKQPLIEKLLAQGYTELLLGGALANDLLRARGLPIGASLVSNAALPESIAGDERIVMPTDLVVTEEENTAERNTLTNDVRATEKIVDIGDRSSVVWGAKIAAAPFVVWNGPMGVYEKGYTNATNVLAEAIAGGTCRAIIGGGDTAAAIRAHTFDTKRVFVSTGGGAMLEFLATGTLPAITPLLS